jgi:hypothetical protein
MSHFLDNNGTIPESLPNKARKLSQRIGAIVLAVTEDPQTSQSTVLPCWNIINGKKCTGLIDAGINLGYIKFYGHKCMTTPLTPFYYFIRSYFA